MKKRLFFPLTLVALALFLAAPTASRAEIALMDGKLILNGFVKNTTYYRTSVYGREFEKGKPSREGNYQSNHDTHADFSNFSALIEALYTIKEDQNSTLRVFSGFKGWYQAAPLYDESLRRSIYPEDRNTWQSPQKLEDVISEMYLDYTSGPWQVRTGKQIVIWGQLDTDRVADVVNPMDLRMGVPGVDTWEEVKQGLWMIRTMYQSQLPGNLMFEFLLNPGHYKSVELPYEGTHWGPESFKNNPFPANRNQGYFSYMQNKWRKDEPPQYALDNYEWGGRVQGYTYDVDWTLLYWNALSDGATAVNVTNAIDYSNRYFDTLAYPNQPKVPDYTAYKYKRFQTVGGTAQTFTSFLDTIWRLEWFLEIGSPVVKGLKGNTSYLYDNSRNEILGVALQGNWNVDIPWFTRVIGTGKQASVSLTYFYETVLTYERDLCLADRYYKMGQRYRDSITLFLMQQMFNASWTFVFIGNYYPQIGKWMAVPCFTYVFSDSGPFSGFRADLGMKIYGGVRHRYTDLHQDNIQNALGNSYDHKDAFILRLRYEF